jgi:chromate transporter
MESSWKSAATGERDTRRACHDVDNLCASFSVGFLGAPYIEKLRGQKRLTAALSTVTAAIVGVILNLAVWFGIHVIFPPSGNIDWFAVIVCAIAFLGMLRWKWNIIPVVLGSGLLGLLFKLAFAR